MRVGANAGRVDEDLANAPVATECGKHSVPHACARPASKALIRAVPAAELGRLIASRAVRTGDPTHRLDKQPPVGPTAAAVPNLPRSPTSSGSIDSIRLHWSSRSCARSAPPTQSPGWKRNLSSIVNRPWSGSCSKTCCARQAALPARDGAAVDEWRPAAYKLGVVCTRRGGDNDAAHKETSCRLSSKAESGSHVNQALGQRLITQS